MTVSFQENLPREEQGERPDLGEYLERFPQFEGLIRRRWPLRPMEEVLDTQDNREETPLSESTIPQGPDDPNRTSLEEVQTEAHVQQSRPAGHPSVPGYEIIKELGHGGMGVVYEARDRTLGRVVALKVLRAGEGADPERVRRFASEARAMAQLDHPHVVPIYEVGEYQGQPYFTMKLVPGGSLGDHLLRFREDPHRAVVLAEKVARAVDYLHDRKILHRDLKPLNILLDDCDEPYVSDFGLAKLLEGGVELTLPGVVMGTLPYMAPEQAVGQTHRFSRTTEVWTLGVILYELLTGSRPFQAQGREELTHQILTADPLSPQALRPGIDPSLESVLLRCLQKEPADRYPSAGALADDLRRWLQGERPQGFSPGRLALGWRMARRHPGKSLVGVLCAAVVLTLAVFSLVPANNQSNPPDEMLTPTEPPVILLGETGRPSQGARWVIGEQGAEQALSPHDGTFFVRSPGFSLLELQGVVPWNRYRLEAEVRHDENAQGQVGVYFAHSRHETPRGVIHAFCKLAFADQRQYRSGSAELELNSYREAQGTLGGAGMGRHMFSRSPPGGLCRWRSFGVEVTPEGLRADWEGAALAEVSEVGVRERSASVATVVGDVQWRLNVSGGLGLYVNNGGASFRSVVIKPLPG